MYYIVKATQHILYYNIAVVARNFFSYKLDNFVRMYRTSKLTHQHKAFLISWISSERKLESNLFRHTFCAAAALKRETPQGPI